MGKYLKRLCDDDTGDLAGYVPEGHLQEYLPLLLVSQLVLGLLGQLWLWGETSR